MIGGLGLGAAATGTGVRYGRGHKARYTGESVREGMGQEAVVQWWYGMGQEGLVQWHRNGMGRRQGTRWSRLGLWCEAWHGTEG